LNPNQAIFNDLSSDPIKFYVLYQIFINPSSIDLPHFMDYGPICQKLEVLSLVQTTPKHIHNKKYNLTVPGRQWIEKYKDMSSHLFSDINLSNSESFRQQFHEKLSIWEKKAIADSIWPLLQSAFRLPVINCPKTYLHIILTLTDLGITHESSSIYHVSFRIKFQCLECKHENEVAIEIRYDLDDYSTEPDVIVFECPICRSIFESDAYFSRIIKNKY